MGDKAGDEDRNKIIEDLANHDKNLYFIYLMVDFKQARVSLSYLHFFFL